MNNLGHDQQDMTKSNAEVHRRVNFNMKFRDFFRIGRDEPTHRGGLLSSENYGYVMALDILQISFIWCFKYPAGSNGTYCKSNHVEDHRIIEVQKQGWKQDAFATSSKHLTAHLCRIKILPAVCTAVASKGHWDRLTTDN